MPFSSVSACATCFCYFVNILLDVFVLVTGEYNFASHTEVKINKLTGVSTNCSDPGNQYKVGCPRSDPTFNSDFSKIWSNHKK